MGTGGARGAAFPRLARGPTYPTGGVARPWPNNRLTARDYAWGRGTNRTNRAAEARCSVTVAAAALVALPASLLTIWLLRRTPAAVHVVAAPRADRWHKRSTPLLGGSGIYAGLLAAAGLAVATG